MPWSNTCNIEAYHSGGRGGCVCGDKHTSLLLGPGWKFLAFKSTIKCWKCLNLKCQNAKTPKCLNVSFGQNSRRLPSWSRCSLWGCPEQSVNVRWPVTSLRTGTPGTLSLPTTRARWGTSRWPSGRSRSCSRWRRTRRRSGKTTRTMSGCRRGRSVNKHYIVPFSVWLGRFSS